MSNFQNNIVGAIRTIMQRLSALQATVDAMRPQVTVTTRRAPFPPVLSLKENYEYVITTGIVVDALAHIGAYRVQVEVPNYMIWAGALRQSTCLQSGATTYGGYRPGDMVIVAVSRTSPVGMIIGAIPPANSIGRLSYPLSQVSGIDFGLSSSAKAAAAYGAPNWANGIPVDDAAVGYFGAAAETGMMFHIDPFMACLKLSELTGLFVFYWDELLRLAGRNFQLWASGSIWEAYNDDGELITYAGDCIYPWELLGALDKDADKLRQFSENELAATPWLNTQEPAEWDQKAFHRVFSYGGYLGLGKKLYIVLPNRDEGDINTYRRTKPNIGVLDVAATISGAAGVRSATSFMLVKTPIIVPPHRKREPNDPTGDTTEGGYKPSGVGASPLDASVPWDSDDYRSLGASMGALDESAHLFNYYSTNPIAEHKKDFLYPDEKKYASDVLGGAKGEYGPDFSEMARGGALSLPPKTTVAVDHRHTVDIYHSTAYVSVLPDGSVSIGDGYGAEIRMGGGKIFIDAPGGIFLQSGREVAVLAGGDIIHTARGSIDIVSKKDARVAADKNLHMVGAIGGGAHGVLIESRSKSDDPSWYFSGKKGEDATIGGIRLLCPESKLVAYAKDIHGVAHGMGSDAGTVKLEATSLNNSQKQGDVILVGDSVYHNVDCAVFNCFTDNEKPRERSPHHIFTAQAVYIDGTALFGHDIAAAGEIQAAGAVKGGSTDNKFFGNNSPASQWKTVAKTAAEKTVAVRPNNRSYEIPTNAYCFTARTDEQYCTQDFTLPECRYAKIAETHGATGLKPWNPVFEINSGAGLSYTYPGKNAKMLRYDPGCYDVSNGCAKNRAEYDKALCEPVPYVVLYAVARPGE